MVPFNQLVKKRLNAVLKQEKATFVIAMELFDVILDRNAYMKALDEKAPMREAMQLSIYNDCIKPLQVMSLRKDIQLMLISDIPQELLHQIRDALESEFGISLYLNSSKLKTTSDIPFYDLLLNPYAGFEPIDWRHVYDAILDFYIIPNYGDSSNTN